MGSNTSTVPASIEEGAPFTLTTGPVDAYSQVLRGLAKPVLYDYDPAFLACYERVTEKLKIAFRTAHTPLILHGEPVLALEAAAASLIAREDVVLNLVSGVYGAGFGYWAKRYCRELLEIRVPYDEVIDPAQVAALLKSRPDITVVSVCHHDTPSGTINPLAEIGGSSPRMGRTCWSMRCPPSAAWTCIRILATRTSSSPARTSVSVLRRGSRCSV